MKLASDWKKVLKEAWSVRLLALALICEGLQLALPYLPAFLMLSPALVSGVMGLLVVAAGIARLVHQESLEAASVSWRDGDLVIVDGRLYRAVVPTEAAHA